MLHVRKLKEEIGTVRGKTQPQSILHFSGRVQLRYMTMILSHYSNCTGLLSIGEIHERFVHFTQSVLHITDSSYHYHKYMYYLVK